MRFVSLVCLVVCAACATTPPPAALDPSDAPALRERVERDASDAGAHRDLGGIYLTQGRHDEATPLLQRALALDSADTRTLLYTGLLYEQTGQPARALGFYARYTTAPRSDRARLLLRGRYEHLTRAQIRQEIQDAAIAEDSLGGAGVLADAVAVFPMRLTSGDEEYRRLGRAMATFILRDLSQVQALTVVERLRLDVLLQEIDLVRKGVVDPATAPRSGRLVGAGTVVTGAYAVSDDDRFHLDLVLQDPRADLRELSADDLLAAFFSVQKDAVFQILDELDVEPTAAERRRILEVPTADLQALLAYARALADEDAGRYGDAADAFADALQAAPDLPEVADRAEEAEALALAEDPEALIDRLASRSTAYRHLLLGQSLGLLTDRSPAREGETDIPCGPDVICGDGLGPTPPAPPPGGGSGTPPGPPGN